MCYTHLGYMQTKNIQQIIILPCTPQAAYKAWMDSKIHGEIIGAHAKIDPKVGGNFSLWDDEMAGKTIELDEKKLKIVQDWRDNGSDWPKDYYSKITLEFTPTEHNQTKLIFTQTGVPEEHVKDIEEGWENFYWKPMKKYFSSQT